RPAGVPDGMRLRRFDNTLPDVEVEVGAGPGRRTASAADFSTSCPGCRYDCLAMEHTSRQPKRWCWITGCLCRRGECGFLPSLRQTPLPHWEPHYCPFYSILKFSRI